MSNKIFLSLNALRRLASLGQLYEKAGDGRYPDYVADILPSVVYGYNAEQVLYRMRRRYCLYKGVLPSYEARGMRTTDFVILSESISVDFLVPVSYFLLNGHNRHNHWARTCRDLCGTCFFPERGFMIAEALLIIVAMSAGTALRGGSNFLDVRC